MTNEPQVSLPHNWTTSTLKMFLTLHDTAAKLGQKTFWFDGKVHCVRRSARIAYYRDYLQQSTETRASGD